LLDPQAIDAALVSDYDRWTTFHGRPLRLHDLTHDLGLSVVAAVAHDIDGGHIAIGFGAGWSSAQAALHAVGELAQFEANLALLERTVAERGSLPNSADARALIDWWRTATLSAHPHLAGSARNTEPQQIEPLDLRGCQTLCQMHGLDFIALDLSRSDAIQSVVRVIVPGLRPIWARFAPGRLFDVPTKLGWREQPIVIDALNPTPLMF
jgi:ribosomal protein S12 methylthiotransferase accessory factor